MIKLIVLPFKINAVKTGHAGYFLPTVEIKDCNFTIDGKNFQKITLGQRGDYTTGSFLVYPYF